MKIQVQVRGQKAKTYSTLVVPVVVYSAEWAGLDFRDGGPDARATALFSGDDFWYYLPKILGAVAENRTIRQLLTETSKAWETPQRAELLDVLGDALYSYGSSVSFRRGYDPRGTGLVSYNAMGGHILWQTVRKARRAGSGRTPVFRWKLIPESERDRRSLRQMTGTYTF